MMKTDKRNLPDGWRWTKLGDICTVIMGQSPEGSTYNVDGVGEPLLNGPTEFGARYPRPAQWTTAPTRFAEPSDILFCVRGATTGRKNVADQRYCIGRGLAAIRGNDQQAITEFLWFALELATETLLRGASGSTFPNLPGEKLQSVEIPLPPPGEQRRIAAKLSEQLAAVERARAAAEAQLEAASALPAAYLREVFESEKARGWETVPLGDVGEIVSGITLGRKFINGNTRKVPYLRVANVKDGHLDLSGVYEIDATDADIAKCQLKYGDMLLTEGGDADKLGRGTFWEEQIPLCLHQNHIFRVRFDLARFSPQFVSYEMGSPYGKAYFLAYAKQTTGIATINQKVLSRFPLMIPTLSEQQFVAKVLTARMVNVEHTRQALQAQLDGINQLPAALLRQAFSGEL